MTISSARDYYAQPGLITALDNHADELNSLPVEVAEICKVIQGLLIHYHTGNLYGVELPPSRLEEVRTRFVSRILDNILHLNPEPFTIARPPLERHIGCCRDFAVLCCAFLRLKGIPARVRVGFANYLEPNTDFWFDHWVTEYWNGRVEQWLRVDPQQDAILRRQNKLSFDPLDIPAHQFTLAGEAWLACHSGKQSPTQYGFEPGETGMWIIRNNLLQDFACLNKMEMTPWDSWGPSAQPYEALSEEVLQKLDCVAELTLSPDGSFAQLRALYENEAELKVPPTVTSYTILDEQTTEIIYAE